MRTLENQKTNCLRNQQQIIDNVNALSLAKGDKGNGVTESEKIAKK